MKKEKVYVAKRKVSEPKVAKVEKVAKPEVVATAPVVEADVIAENENSSITTAALDSTAARDTVIENLKYAAPRFQAAGMKLLVEAVNTRDIPGFFVVNTSQILDILDAVASDNVFLQYDVYHMSVMGEDVVRDPTRATGEEDDIIDESDGRGEDGTVSADETLELELELELDDDDDLELDDETGESGTRYPARSRESSTATFAGAWTTAGDARTGMSLFDGSLSPPKMLL